MVDFGRDNKELGEKIAPFMQAKTTADGYSVFVNMFFAIDASWEKCKDETLAGYLSEASPFTFGGKGSADPAVWSEFSAAFTNRFPEGEASLEDAHGFVMGYLGGINDEYSKVYPGKKRLVDAFEEIAPLGRWVEVFELQNVEDQASLPRSCDDRQPHES